MVRNWGLRQWALSDGRGYDFHVMGISIYLDVRGWLAFGVDIFVSIPLSEVVDTSL